MTTTRSMRAAGSLFFMAGGLMLMGIITAEALYPAPYSTGGNAISDLGGTEPPASLVLQPSATIFDTTMIVAGLLVLGGAVALHRAIGRWSATLVVVAMGAGVLGVGLFPGSTGTIHALFAELAFIGGGIAAIVTARTTEPPFRYLAVALGTISLAALGSYAVLGDASPLAGLGFGGLERWIAYPLVIWLTGFGGYLSARAVAPESAAPAGPPA